jgi:hypothetical protein
MVDRELAGREASPSGGILDCCRCSADCGLRYRSRRVVSSFYPKDRLVGALKAAEVLSVEWVLAAARWDEAQRAKATSNAGLRAILEHNRDEEKEHAAMVLEWLRRGDPKLSQHLKTYLFTKGSITEIEAVAEHGGGGEGGGQPASIRDDSLGIGSLRLPTRRGST